MKILKNKIYYRKNIKNNNLFYRINLKMDWLNQNFQRLIKWEYLNNQIYISNITYQTNKP